MKKIGILLLALTMSFILVSCGNKVFLPEEYTDKTPFEELKEIVDNFDLGIDLNDIKVGISLPKKTDHPTLEISWRTDNPDYVTIDGHVNRPSSEEDPVEVKLTGVFTIGGSRLEKNFYLTVIPQPSNEENILAEDIELLELYPFDTIYTDYLILPRVTYNGSYITWETSDASVIDLDGNVSLPNEGEADKTVILTAQLSSGGMMAFKDFPLTVSYKAPSVEIINQNDPRILNIIEINNKTELIAASLNAKPGDALVLKPGRFNDVNITLTKSGTEENPIFIIGTPNETLITGESTIQIKANHVVVANLKFVDGHPTNDRGAIWLNGDHLRLTNTMFYNYESFGYDHKWLSLTGQFHEIDRNTFDTKSTGGSLLTVWRDDRSAQFHHIYQNVFKNYANGGGQNGYETIRFGTSIHSQSDSYTLLENNLFEDVNGEIEIISVKSGRNMIRNNTFVRSLGHITLRHGINSVVENNVFLASYINDTGGVRIYDGGHVIRQNYIDSVNTSSNTRAGIVIHSGVNIPPSKTVLNAQWTPYNLLIENNTIYNSRQSILFDGKYSQVSVDVTLRNNLVVARTGQAAIRYDKQHINPIFINEHYFSDVSYSGGGAYNPPSVPNGVTFVQSFLEIELTNGLHLHNEWGATTPRIVASNQVGVLWLRD